MKFAFASYEVETAYGTVCYSQRDPARVYAGNLFLRPLQFHGHEVEVSGTLEWVDGWDCTALTISAPTVTGVRLTVLQAALGAALSETWRAWLADHPRTLPLAALAAATNERRAALDVLDLAPSNRAARVALCRAEDEEAALQLALIDL